MRHFIRAAFILISMSTNNALSKTAEANPQTVKIENYNFEYEQTGGRKPFVEASAGEDEGATFNSVTLNYTLKLDSLVESPTLMDSLKKTAEEKCGDLASGSAAGKLISKKYVSSPWKISGSYICSFE